MDTVISFGQLAALLKGYGPFGILVVIWYFDMRFLRKMNDQYRKETSDILKQHEDYMAEIRRMYESNVRLVEGYEGLASDLKDLIVMNTQQLTRLTDDITQNQYCPAVRVEKKSIKVASS